jgi:hypothetical protein
VSARIVTSCGLVARRGETACLGSCAMEEPGSVFSYVRVGRADDLAPADPQTIDVAVLDMNHGWPNLGHNSIVHTVREAACDFESALRAAGLNVRVFSFDVRRTGRLPEPPGGRFSLYLGTGGPGHIDPWQNDGVQDFAQGVVEDPSWERAAFDLFDAIQSDKSAALLAVCHSFGVLCRWSGVAAPRRRGPEKGGKSAGILENVLTAEGSSHPWFSRFARRLNGHEAPLHRFKMIDSRLFDLIPEPGSAPYLRFSYETAGVGGPRGDALTGVEFARDRGDIMPRVMGVNHHPEIMDRDRQMLVLQRQFNRGEVTKEWYDERFAVVSRSAQGPDVDDALALTTGFTFVWPLRFHLARQIRERAETRRRPIALHEDQILSRPDAPQ